jgi:hypothetical protein
VAGPLTTCGANRRSAPQLTTRGGDQDHPSSNRAPRAARRSHDMRHVSPTKQGSRTPTQGTCNSPISRIAARGPGLRVVARMELVGASQTPRSCKRPRDGRSRTIGLPIAGRSSHRASVTRVGVEQLSCWEASERSLVGIAALALAVAAEPGAVPTTAAISDAKDRDRDSTASLLDPHAVPQPGSFCTPTGRVMQRRLRSARRRRLEAVQRARALPRCVGSRVGGRRADRPAPPPVRRRPASGGG